MAYEKIRTVVEDIKNEQSNKIRIWQERHNRLNTLRLGVLETHRAAADLATRLLDAYGVELELDGRPVYHAGVGCYSAHYARTSQPIDLGELYPADEDELTYGYAKVRTLTWANVEATTKGSFPLFGRPKVLNIQPSNVVYSVDVNLYKGGLDQSRLQSLASFHTARGYTASVDELHAEKELSALLRERERAVEVLQSLAFEGSVSLEA